jgi:hypothetical protein
MHAIVTGHAKSASIIWGQELTGGYTSHGKRKGLWQGMELGATWAGSRELGWIGHAIWLNRWPLLGKGFSEIGIGLGWATSPFDPLKAPRSFALGSHANAALRVNIGYAWNIRQLGQISLSGGLTHFSNGAIVLPNLGINVIGVQCTVSPRVLESIRPTKTAETQFETKQGLCFETTVRFGVRDIGLPRGVLHPTSTWMSSVHYRHRENNNWSLSAAVDLGFNQSLRINGIPEAFTNPAKRIQTAVLFGARCHYGRAALTLMQGWMLTQKDVELGTRHLHAALQQAIFSKWRIEVGLRSFRLRADSPFVGVVWCP